jgi:uncharacterized Tic20 family protein
MSSEDITLEETSSEVVDNMGMNPNTFCMLMHLSQLLGPIFGMAVPIVLWAIGKDKSAQVDQQGKFVVNWIISLYIYGLAAGGLCLVGVGLLLILGLLILGFVFPVIGAVKANNGIAWKYPLSIPFFR